MKASNVIRRTMLAAIPAERERSVAKWGERHVKTYGVRGNKFDPVKTPWIIEPLERTDDGMTRVVTVVGPVQSAKSVIEEVAVCRWLATNSGGDVQWNFQDDEFADDRYDKRIRRILDNCEPVENRRPRNEREKKGLILFPHCSLTIQGVFTRKNVASDSIRFQANDEIHLWEPGRLLQAHNRTTACWNSIVVNVSNASVMGDQLHTALVGGTHQAWEVRCPACGKHHVMRTLWDKDHPELGGLRYDAEGCRMEGGDYDYQKMLGTIRYQMPCGAEVRDDTAIRRAMSMGGRYGEPRNKGALLTHRSYTMDGVSIDYIPWVKLIQEKHESLKAMRYGDPEPYKRYLQERECRFWDPEERPLSGRIVVTSNVKKNRDGLKGRFARYFSLDRQQGSLKAGELPHWWLVIRDVMPNGDSMLVWEGRCLTDDDAIGVIKEHGCMMRHGVADSGDDTTHVYQFCLRHGINAIKGSGEPFLRHKDGARRIYSEERPLHLMLNAPPTKSYQRKFIDKEFRLVPHVDEPLFWFYSNPGLMDRFYWLRGEKSVVEFGIPEDVSLDYRKHMEAWTLEERRTAKSNQLVSQWVQVSRRDDLHKCEQYIVMLMEMAGLIGERAAK